MYAAETNRFVVRVGHGLAIGVFVLTMTLCMAGAALVSVMNTATDFVDHVTDAAAGVTYHFSHSVEVGRYWNGDIFVVSDGSDIEITRITPDSRALESGRIVNGAVVDPSIDNSQGALNGFDSGIAYNSYDPTSNADPGTTGTSLVISHDAHPEGVSIVKVVSNEGFTDARHATYDNSVLTIVNEVPPAGAFRPAVAAASKESTFTIDDLDFSVLQSVEPVEGQRPLSDFDDLPDATVASWITQGSESRGHYPTKYFDDYGDYRMEQLADGFMALHSNYSDAEKADLYASFVQIGLDYAGAVDAGKTFTSGGGGLNNYVKPFVVLAAAALDDEGLSETAGYRPSVYGEDQQFFYVSEEHTAHESFNWGGNKKPTFQEQYAAEQIGLPEWGLFTFDNRNSSLLDSNPYRSINSDTMIQVALVTEMLGADAAAIWGNQAYFDYADRSYDIYGDRLPGAWQAFYEQYHETYKTSADWEGMPETILQLDLRESPDGVFVHIGTPGEGTDLPLLRTDLRYSTDGQSWTVLTDVGAETTLTDVPAGTFLYVQARHVNDIGAGRWSLNNFTTTNATIHKTLQGLGFVDIPEAYGTDYGLGRKEYTSLSTSYKDHLRDLLDGIEDPGVGSSVQTFIHGAIQIAPESERDQLRDARSVFLETFEGEDNTGLPVQPVEDGRALRMEDASGEAQTNIILPVDRVDLVDLPAPTGPTNGDDTLLGTALNDTINAFAGNDNINGLAGDDLLLGGSSNDSIKGAAGDDRLRGNRGEDTLKGGGGDDNIKGNGGDDVIRGNGGDDYIKGNGGDDVIRGNGGDDYINGGGGADRLNGGGGGDTLRGNGGDDTLKGNGGADVFQFRISDRNDTIVDFRQGQDRIEILNGARSFDALDLEQDGRDVLIGFGAGQVRVVTDNVEAFDESDFIF